jgi:hypothetical protein
VRPPFVLLANNPLDEPTTTSFLLIPPQAKMKYIRPPTPAVPPARIDSHAALQRRRLSHGCHLPDLRKAYYRESHYRDEWRAAIDTYDYPKLNKLVRRNLGFPWQKDHPSCLIKKLTTLFLAIEQRQHEAPENEQAHPDIQHWPPIFTIDGVFHQSKWIMDA